MGYFLERCYNIFSPFVRAVCSINLLYKSLKSLPLIGGEESQQELRMFVPLCFHTA